MPGDEIRVVIADDHAVRTVETRRAHIRQKPRLSSRAELVRHTIDHGLIPT